MAPVRGPAVPRRRLGAELRRLRDDAGLTLEQVAEQLECSTSKISRLETGKGIPKARDIRDMLLIYEVKDTRVRDRLLRWARDGQQQGWWHGYADVMDEKWETFVSLEADAESMSAYETTVVHGLLQTPDYTREIAKVILGNPDPSELDLFVELRMLRQQVLAREDGALKLHVILEEPAVYRPIGGPDVLRAQLSHLLKMADHPAVTLQVLGLNAGAHPAMGSSFALLTFAADLDHGVVYAEGVGGAVILEHQKDVETYTTAFAEIRSRAMDVRASATFIDSILKGTD